MTNRIHDWLHTSANKTPERTAIVWQNHDWTFAALEQQSNQLAHMLREQGCQRGARVGFCIAKSPAAYIAMHAALKADCVYVPLDPQGPAKRLAQVITASDPTVVLCGNQTLAMTKKAIEISERAGIRLGLIEPTDANFTGHDTVFNATDVAAMPTGLPVSENRSDDAAHILFTSGSTGTPKGVVITHANVTTFVDWGLRYFGITASDKLSGHSPLFFDLSTFDTYAAIAAGAELHPVPPGLNLMAPALVRFIRQRELTQWFSVPSVLNYLKTFDAIAPSSMPALKRLIWCGETLPTPTLRWLMEKLPDTQFTNLYGPTEATIASSYYTVPSMPGSDAEPVPIGFACEGESLHVLDESGNPLPADATGDLYIGGSGLSPGYWRDEQKTAEVFIDTSAKLPGFRRLYKTGDLAHIDTHGVAHFHGRADTQIKSRGYRIELGEIESALNAIEALASGAIVAIDSEGFEGQIICCAYQLKSEQSLDEESLANQLRSNLPSYMLPARWMAVASMPSTANGKINRPVLRQQFAERESSSVDQSYTDGQTTPHRTTKVENE